MPQARRPSHLCVAWDTQYRIDCEYVVEEERPQVVQPVATAPAMKKYPTQPVTMQRRQARTRPTQARSTLATDSTGWASQSAQGQPRRGSPAQASSPAQERPAQMGAPARGRPAQMESPARGRPAQGRRTWRPGRLLRVNRLPVNRLPANPLPMNRLPVKPRTHRSLKMRSAL